MANPMLDFLYSYIHVYSELSVRDKIFNFCNWYSNYKNFKLCPLMILFKEYRTTQHILVDSIDKYSFWIFT